MNEFKKIVFFIFIAIIVLSISKPVIADTSKYVSSFQGGFHLGFSPYLGILGAELQKNKYALTLGLPASVGIKYYFKERPNNWFIGAHALYYNIDKDKTIEGIRYEEKEVIISGLGMGYKWRFKDHWDLVFSVSLAYQSEEYTNSFAKRKEESIIGLPGLTIGYTF